MVLKLDTFDGITTACAHHIFLVSHLCGIFHMRWSSGKSPGKKYMHKP